MDTNPNFVPSPNTLAAPLDTRNLHGGLAMLLITRFLEGLPVGQILHVVGNTPKAVADLETLAFSTCHTLLGYGETNGLFHFWIRKGAVA